MSKRDNTDEKDLVAPCGMYCGICSAYLAQKNGLKGKGVKAPYCIGCRTRNKKCAFLKKRCRLLLENKIEFCYECPTYPCDRLRHLDEKYRTFFRTSFIENLERIKKAGIQKFLEEKNKEWKCPKCGGTICCHNGICYSCGLEKLKKKSIPHRWSKKG